MNKKYIVRLTDEERAAYEAMVKTEKGNKADVDGPGWKELCQSWGCVCRGLMMTPRD